MGTVNFAWGATDARNAATIARALDLVRLGVNDEAMQRECDLLLSPGSRMTRTNMSGTVPASVMCSFGQDAIMMINGASSIAQQALIASGYLGTTPNVADQSAWNVEARYGGPALETSHRQQGQPRPGRIILFGFSWGGVLAGAAGQAYMIAGVNDVRVVSIGSPMASRLRPVGANRLQWYRYMGSNDVVPSICPPQGQAGVLYASLPAPQRLFMQAFRHFSDGTGIRADGTRTLNAVPPVQVPFTDVSLPALMQRGEGLGVGQHTIQFYAAALRQAALADDAMGVNLRPAPAAVGQPLAVVVPPVVAPPGPPLNVPQFTPLNNLGTIAPQSDAFYLRRRKPLWVVIRLGVVVATFPKKRPARRRRNELNKLRKAGLLNA